MSVRTLAIAMPVAMFALGVIASTASAASPYSTPAPSLSHSAAWNLDKVEIGHKKKQRQTSRKRLGRFSGFGFRGDGFRTSGQYQ